MEPIKKITYKETLLKENIKSLIKWTRKKNKMKKQKTNLKNEIIKILWKWSVDGKIDQYSYEDMTNELVNMVEKNKQMVTQKFIDENKKEISSNLPVSGSFKLATKTGRLMFRFDNDEPQKCATIYDYGKVVIEMRQQKELDDDLQQNTNFVEFTSKNGKKFRLFIKNYR